jgi:hypothetical protein
MTQGEIDNPVVSPTYDAELGASLARLEVAWRREGAAIANSLAPGRDAAETAREASAAGLVLPDCLVVWWSWHDGTDPRATHGRRRWTGTSFDLLSLDEALTLREQLLADYGTSMTKDPRQAWRPEWMPFAGSWDNALFVDTSEKLPYTPVRLFNAEWDAVDRVRAFTLTEVAEAWLHMLERPWTRWVPEAGAWQDEPSGPPLYLTSSGLI